MLIVSGLYIYIRNRTPAFYNRIVTLKTKGKYVRFIILVQKIDFIEHDLELIASVVLSNMLCN